MPTIHFYCARNMNDVMKTANWSFHGITCISDNSLHVVNNKHLHLAKVDKKNTKHPLVYILVEK